MSKKNNCAFDSTHGRVHGALILTRFSTDKQNETSTEDQIDICTQWCRRNGIPILDIFSDEAVSGMKQSRSRYEDMMSALRAGQGDTVVIYDQSRMFRRMTAWFDFRDELEALGVQVISATQPLVGKDLRDPQNFMYEGTTALFNQMWVLQTRQRVMVTMRRMAREGLWTGGRPPLGYKITDGVLTVCEPEAATVRRIFAEYANGKSYREIIEGLNRDGLQTRAGRPFGSNSLHDMLKNEKYIGAMVYGKAPRRACGSRNSHDKSQKDLIRVENAIPPIVDQVTWEKVQKKMVTNQRTASGRPATLREYPLKGKIFCGECGAAMTGTTAKYKYHYYACSGKQRLKNCDLLPVKMEELEAYIANAIRQVLGDPGNIDRMIRKLQQESQAIQQNTEGRLDRIVSRITELDKQLDQAVDAILNGLNSPVLTKRIQTLESEKASLELERQQTLQMIDATSVPEATLRSLFQAAIATDNASILLHLVSRVEVFHDTIKIWTVFDDDGTDPDRRISSIEESSMIPVENTAATLSLHPVIKTVCHGSPAPKHSNPNLLPIGETFGFVVYLS